MKAWWNSLNDRERRVLLAGGVCGVFIFYYVVLYAPLSSAVQNKAKQLTDRQRTLAWMQQARLKYKKTGTPQSMDSSKLLSVLSGQLKHASFHSFPYQLQQTGSGDIQLSFDQVPYNAFVSWLWKMGKHYAFTIKLLSSERINTPGMAKVMVTLAGDAH